MGIPNSSNKEYGNVLFNDKLIIPDYIRDSCEWLKVYVSNFGFIFPASVWSVEEAILGNITGRASGQLGAHRIAPIAPPPPNLDRSALGSNLEKSGKMKTVCTEVGVLANVFTDIFAKQNPTESYRMILDLIRCMVADLILDLNFDFMQLLIWDLVHLTLATFPPVHCWTLSLNYLGGEWSIQKSKYQ